MNTYKGDLVAGLVRMEYLGGAGSVTPGNAGRSYQGDMDVPGLRSAMVHPDDIALLEASGAWRRAPEVVAEPKTLPDSYTRYRRKPGT